MNRNRWIVWLAVGGLLVAACRGGENPTSPPDTEIMCPPCPTCELCPEPAAACDPLDTTASDQPRERGWVLFTVADPESAAFAVMDKANDADDGNTYVIVRADVVASEEVPLLAGTLAYNLVVAVDASAGKLGAVADMLREALGEDSYTILRVEAHFPTVPHSASTFITPGEYEQFPLPEYCPPGRHPQSPGANPWG